MKTLCRRLNIWACSMLICAAFFGVLELMR
jgi:hypothetical protein